MIQVGRMTLSYFQVLSGLLNNVASMFSSLCDIEYMQDVHTEPV